MYLTTFRSHSLPRSIGAHSQHTCLCPWAPSWALALARRHPIACTCTASGEEWVRPRPGVGLWLPARFRAEGGTAGLGKGLWLWDIQGSGDKDATEPYVLQQEQQHCQWHPSGPGKARDTVSTRTRPPPVYLTPGAQVPGAAPAPRRGNVRCPPNTAPAPSVARQQPGYPRTPRR